MYKQYSLLTDNAYADLENLKNIPPEERNFSTENYEEFLKGIENLYDDQSWIEEVITLATSPLSRQLQTHQN